jgi:DNA polymerase III alpha subunit
MLLKTDDLGIPRFTNRDLIDMIYTGNIEKCHIVLCDTDVDVDAFNAAADELGLPELSKYIPLTVDKDKFDEVCRSEWYMPDKYKSIKLEAYLWDKLPKKDGAEYPRMLEELREFHNRDMTNLLRYMIYLVDFMRENKIVWGVGRGSSVASYVLYLIGIHSVDSLKYNLDWREFLR